jgi:hypothetical protein
MENINKDNPTIVPITEDDVKKFLKKLDDIKETFIFSETKIFEPLSADEDTTDDKKLKPMFGGGFTNIKDLKMRPLN